MLAQVQALQVTASTGEVARVEWLARTWQTDGGLHDNNVTGLAQSADGYLWVATLGSLMRFDGSRFEEFSTVHLPKVPSRGVRRMFLGRSGRLWLATDRGGLIRVDEKSARVFTAEDGLYNARVACMAEDQNGTLWVVCGSAVCRIQGDKVEQVGSAQGLPEGGGSWLTTDGRGQLWFARGTQVGVLRAGRWEVWRNFEAGPIRLLAARGGGMWVSSGPHVLKLSEGSEPAPVARLPDGAVVRCLLEERNGTLWVGTAAGGLFRLQGREFTPVAVSHPEISALMQDVEGNLWVGTAGGGLDLLRPQAMQMVTTKSGLPFESVRSVCEDAEGWMWAALQDGSLAHGRGVQWSAVTITEGWPGGQATCVAPARGGGVWIGTRDRGLQRLQAGRIQEWTLPEASGGGAVRSLLAASNGDLWVAVDSPSRLLMLREGAFRSLKVPGGMRSMRTLAEDADGTMWVGTSDGQILHVTGSAVMNETQRLKEQSLSVRCLHAAADGSLLIGFAGWGVGRRHNGNYKRIGAARGLHDEYVSQILSDGKGGLWLTGNRGLFQVRLDELAAVAEGREERVHSIAYGRNEGLPSFQAVFDNSPAAWRGADGCLWFSTRNGLLVVSPGEIRDNPSPPPVLLTQVRVDDQLVALRDSQSPLRAGVESRAKDLCQPGLKLALPPGHAKLEFEFTALSFNSPENVHFRHRLKGFDTEWVEIGPQRAAKYPRLSAGSYEFEVTACNETGVWSETGFRLPFVVEPFFWQTWWFRGLLLATFTAGVVATVRYVSFRRLRQQMARLEQQAVLDKERGRIAKDLHDDLGASMTQMTLLLELALQHRSNPATVLDRVEDGLRAGREAIKSLDAAVWAVNPANNTLPELVAYIGQFGMEFLQQAKIRCELELPDQPPERPVSAELRHNLFLIVKEALNNVVRHAQASTVRLQIAITPATLDLLIEDDGRGIEREPQDGLADGLRNMRQRAGELKAEFRLESKPGAGTRITFRYPWPASR